MCPSRACDQLHPNDEISVMSLRQRLDDGVTQYLGNAELVRVMRVLLDSPARPIVVDANRLRGEIRALAWNGRNTALVTLAEIGFLRLFAAAHVLDEVDEYLDEWAHETRTPCVAYRDAWVSVLRPLITEASFSRDLLTTDELARIELLDKLPPFGDPDDVPTAIAAMVLAAPLLSGDPKPLAAVYGPGVDLVRHDAYLKMLFGGGRVLVVSHWGRVALLVVRLVGGLGASGVRALAGKTGSMPLLIGAAVVAGWSLSNDRARALLVQSKEPLRAFASALAEVYSFYLEAEIDYKRLESPAVHDLDLLPARVAAARTAARRSAFVPVVAQAASLSLGGSSSMR
jgi:hypothetical protein